MRDEKRQLFLSSLIPHPFFQLGTVEVVPGVSEGALLRCGQKVQHDALETAHRQGVFQESPKVALVQAGGDFLEHPLVHHESVQMRDKNRSR